MKIALVNTISPFIRGGAEILVDDLYTQLVKRGHNVELFCLPFPNDYEVQLLELVLASKFLDFSDYDRVIAFKFPAYCVCHRHKKLWMFHQFRQVYDLFGAEDGLLVNPETEALKRIITEIDNRDIAGAEQVFVNAWEVANRLKKYNGLDSIVLPPPLLNYEEYFNEQTGDYFYYPSRVNSLKRQHIAVEAMRYVQTDVKLVVEGVCPDSEYDRLLKDTIKKFNLGSKVTYNNTWIDDDDKIKKIANSLGVIYIPYLEDSCGFVTMEGFYAAKPVLSFVDSGGTKEFIKNDVSGYLVEPTPQALAAKMDYLFMHRDLAKRMGENARKDILAQNITWDETVRRLLS